MKIVNIAGGLGNQMFQYAFALALKEHFPDEEIMIDISTFKGLKYVRSYELDNVFNVDLPVAGPRELRKVTYYFENLKVRQIVRKLLGMKQTEYKEPRVFTYWGEETFTVSGDCYYEGSWQNEAYFKQYESLVRKVYTFKKKLDEQNEIIKKEICGNNSISIHVRRGDYLSIPYYQDICDEPYYRNAIHYVKKNIKEPHFYIFSTDTAWCSENIVPLLDNSPFTIISWNQGAESYKDMQLMSCCKHNIIAHSSFSWWAAWLNDNKNKCVVAPKEWFRRDDITDLPQLPNWILMENK